MRPWLSLVSFQGTSHLWGLTLSNCWFQLYKQYTRDSSHPYTRDLGISHLHIFPLVCFTFCSHCYFTRWINPQGFRSSFTRSLLSHDCRCYCGHQFSLTIYSPGFHHAGVSYRSSEGIVHKYFGGYSQHGQRRWFRHRSWTEFRFEAKWRYV